jgi:hypothetical protein
MGLRMLVRKLFCHSAACRQVIFCETNAAFLGEGSVFLLAVAGGQAIGRGGGAGAVWGPRSWHHWKSEAAWRRPRSLAIYLGFLGCMIYTPVLFGIQGVEHDFRYVRVVDIGAAHWVI